MRIIDFICEIATISERLARRAGDEPSPGRIAAMTLATFSRQDLTHYLVASLGAEVTEPLDQLIGAALRLAQLVHWEASCLAIGLQLPTARMAFLGSASLPRPPWFVLLDEEEPTPATLDPADAFQVDSLEARGERRVARRLDRIDLLARYCVDENSFLATAATLFRDRRAAEGAGLLVAPRTVVRRCRPQWRDHPRLLWSGPLLEAGEASVDCVYLSSFEGLTPERGDLR